jgi:hypothetical protein
MQKFGKFTKLLSVLVVSSCVVACNGDGTESKDHNDSVKNILVLNHTAMTVKQNTNASEAVSKKLIVSLPGDEVATSDVIVTLSSSALQRAKLVSSNGDGRSVTCTIDAGQHACNFVEFNVGKELGLVNITASADGYATATTVVTVQDKSTITLSGVNAVSKNDTKGGELTATLSDAVTAEKGVDITFTSTEGVLFAAKDTEGKDVKSNTTTCHIAPKNDTVETGTTCLVTVFGSQAGKISSVTASAKDYALEDKFNVVVTDAPVLTMEQAVYSVSDDAKDLVVKANFKGVVGDISKVVDIFSIDNDVKSEIIAKQSCTNASTDGKTPASCSANLNVEKITKAATVNAAYSNSILPSLDYATVSLVSVVVPATESIDIKDPAATVDLTPVLTDVISKDTDTKIELSVEGNIVTLDGQKSATCTVLKDKKVCDKPIKVGATSVTNVDSPVVITTKSAGFKIKTTTVTVLKS